MQISKKPTCIINSQIEWPEIGKMFIPTNNYNLSHLKQPKSNPCLSILVKSSQYGKWKPIQILESILSFASKKTPNYEMIAELCPPPEFQIFRKNILHFSGENVLFKLKYWFLPS